MSVVRAVVCLSFAVTGAYIGFCAGQLTTYYATRWLLSRELLEDT